MNPYPKSIAIGHNSGMVKSMFGEIAVEQGFLTPEQLEQALRLQQGEDADGRPHRPLGIICLQEGLLRYDDVMRILGEQERRRGGDAAILS